MRTTRAKTPLATYMFGLRPGPFTLVALLGAGGKPSTWLPPGKLADLLKKYISTCYLHTLISFSGVCPEFLMHVVISECSVIFSHIAWFFPLLRCCFPLLSCYVSHAHCASQKLCDTLRVSVLFIIAVLLLCWAVLLYFFPFMPQSHVTSDIPHASRHLLVCIQHSLCT